MTTNLEIIDRLVAARVAAGLTRGEVAARVGVTEEALSCYEDQTRWPLKVTVTAWCRELDIERNPQ